MLCEVSLKKIRCAFLSVCCQVWQEEERVFLVVSNEAVGLTSEIVTC